jgi:hypothetical protein
MDFKNEIFSEITALNKQTNLGELDVNSERLNTVF